MPEGFLHGGNVFAVARALGVAPEEITDFSASINPLGPSPQALQALQESIPRLVHYPEEDASTLRSALARRHGVEASQVVAANGSTQLIHLIPRLFPGRRALIVGPAFSEYARGLERSG
ncbi:MAG TPA: aminotransferase class I/II-fold pyridoxal phosphate-dependent enzyme, partial [Verrucomicrobiae bacterium]|nr:aminotransferase class I/II-fold pyridoxal phosphate-dependent enzyme [Verrucomicrobiae bacterium]